MTASPSYDTIIRACKSAMVLDRGGTPLIARYLKNAQLPLDSTGNYSVKGKRIRNIGKPQEPKDAATTEYVHDFYEKNNENIKAEIKENIEKIFKTEIQKFTDVFQQIIENNLSVINKLNACINNVSGLAVLIESQVKKVKNIEVLQELRDDLSVLEMELETLKHENELKNLSETLKHEDEFKNLRETESV